MLALRRLMTAPTSHFTRRLSSASTSAAAGACPVTPALRVAVAATLLASSIYLASHSEAVDAHHNFGPRSGLHYYPSATSHSLTTASSSPASRPSSTPSSAFPRISAATAPRASAVTDVMELRCAGIIGRTLAA